MHAKSLQLCLTLCDPMDCSLPGSFVCVCVWACVCKDTLQMLTVRTSTFCSIFFYSYSFRTNLINLFLVSWRIWILKRNRSQVSIQIDWISLQGMETEHMYFFKTRGEFDVQQKLRLWQTVWKSLKKFNIEGPCDPAVLLLCVYSKELKAGTLINLFIYFKYLSI